MGDPGYDFFATGRPAAAPEPASRFGTPMVAAPAAAAAPVEPPSVEPAAFAIPPISGYQPGNVNQFGTPLDEVRVPTGPYAAPGIGAAPVEAPGLLTTWGGPPVAGQHGRARPAAYDVRPGGVLAAGIIGIVEGVLLLVIALFGVAGYVALQSQVAALEAQAGFEGAGELVAGVSTILLLAILVTLVIGLLYLLAGIAAVRGRRWGAWTLLVVSALNVVYGAFGFLGGTRTGLGDIVALLIALLVVVLIVTRGSWSWLRRTGP